MKYFITKVDQIKPRMGFRHMTIISATEISVHFSDSFLFPLLLPLLTIPFFFLFAQNKYQEPYSKSIVKFIDKIMQEQQDQCQNKSIIIIAAGSESGIDATINQYNKKLP